MDADTILEMQTPSSAVDLAKPYDYASLMETTRPASLSVSPNYIRCCFDAHKPYFLPVMLLFCCFYRFMQIIVAYFVEKQ